MPPSIDHIDACLPQTQCTRCGYPRCREYAAAIARGEARINQCPPGGEVTITLLAELLGVPSTPLDPYYGIHGPRTTAVIDEDLCIGCTLCIQACPVDAIVGAVKLMHTVLADECTGCELCLPPCPMDCIAMIPYPQDSSTGDWPWPEYSRVQANHARRRTEARLARLTHHRRQEDKDTATPHQKLPSREQMQAEIRAAVARVQAKQKERDS